jgi:hypothetical protein
MSSLRQKQAIVMAPVRQNFREEYHLLCQQKNAFEAPIIIMFSRVLLAGSADSCSMAFLVLFLLWTLY